MVTKKNTESQDNGNAAQRPNPPYPTSPIDPSKVPASSAYPPDSSFDLIDMRDARSKPRRDSDVSSHGTWDESEDEDKQEQPVDIPKPLHITPSKQNLAGRADEQHGQGIPASLQPGPAYHTDGSMDAYANHALANPWANDAQRLSPQITGRSQSSKNPYLKPKQTGEAAYQSWPSHQSPVPQPPQAAPPLPPFELPTVSTPSHELSQMSLGPGIAATSGSQTFDIPQTSTSTSHMVLRKPVSSVQEKGQSTLSPVVTQHASLMQASDPWQLPSSPTAQQKWGEDKDLLPPGTPPAPFGQLPDHEGASSHSTPSLPQLPPRTSTQQVNTTHTNDRLHESPETIEQRHRSEHYQIKHINWQEGNASSVRQSPILTQNANGPCPLLALVNALVLTTPANATTALVETLRTREQISLGLLLDAVFDELMSGRRGESASALPDVSDLYSFLLALHTGMNVNPRFVPMSNTSSSDMNGVRNASTQTKAGSFEETREMRLYSTFSLPLIHGWVPPPDSEAYQAFERRAQSFEDAQNIQFAEAELEDKLQSEGLSDEEQQILQDIQTIKRFLMNWPTQLTDHGLQAISSTLHSGQFAILFRNDHFSTIYKEPTHGALMTLVTDTGYSSHDEIVWESLVDVNGAASELFSGDFRGVSHDQDVRSNQHTSAPGEQDWQAVQVRQGNSNSGTPQHGSREEAPPPLPGPRPNAAVTSPTSTDEGKHNEQEDHDFALALQLQEEEDAQQRQQQEERRREQQLSEQFLSGQNEGRPPAIPPRRGGSRQSTSVRPAVNRPADQIDPDAPPTYEQSASDRPYREGNGQSSPLNAYDALRRQQDQQQSAYAAQSSNSLPLSTQGRMPSYNNRTGRRTSQLGPMPGGFDASYGRRPGQAATAQDAEERCTLM